MAQEEKIGTSEKIGTREKIGKREKIGTKGKEKEKKDNSYVLLHPPGYNKLLLLFYKEGLIQYIIVYGICSLVLLLSQY